MGDWLQIHDWLHDNMAALLDSALHGSPLDAYSGGLATVIATGLTCYRHRQTLRPNGSFRLSSLGGQSLYPIVRSLESLFGSRRYRAYNFDPQPMRVQIMYR